MLQIANLTEYTEKDIPQLLQIIRPILTKRKTLHERYTRGATQSKTLFDNSDKKTKVPLEKFITDLATGYLAGNPSYSVDVSTDEDKNRILTEIFEKEQKNNDYAKRIKLIIDYITKYNDDNQEIYDLFHDVLELTACYEILYENEDNEIVYSRLDPLQTVATWDYSIPANLTGFVRVWDEQYLENATITKVELTDINGSRTYRVQGSNVAIDELNNHNWGDVPGFAVEVESAIFESSEDLIRAYEQLIQNARNTYQYNDSDCKLMVMNYGAREPLTIIDNEGNYIPNPARAIEDNELLSAKTFFVGQDGDIKWLTKPVDANGIIELSKMYIDGAFQIASIPNTTDLAFNSNSLNASAIDRKFWVMNMTYQKIKSLIEKGLLRRFELIFNRINIKKSTKYDFRDININIPNNLPSNDVEIADYLLKFKDLISDQTIIEQAGFDYYSEKQKKDSESEDNIQMNLDRMNRISNTETTVNEQQTDTEEEMETNRRDIEETVSDDTENI